MQSIAGTIFVQVILYVITAAIAAVAAGATHLLVQLAGKTKLQQMETQVKTEAAKIEAATTAMGITNDVVNKAVLFVQQEYEALGGPAKLQKAIGWAVTQLNARGVLVTDDEVSGLISAALKLAKKDFGDNWASQVDTPATPPVLPIAIGPDTIPAAQTVQPYSATFAATGGAGGYAYSVDAVANGLTLDAATGVLSGTPLTAGSLSFTVTVKDSAGATASRTYTLTVNPAS